MDLHVHSKFSTRPSQWFLQKLNAPESFSEPKKIYQIARSRGMDFVTISDHNTIQGSLEIAHLENTFISEEITTYFPEDNCKIHVLALDILEKHHEDISRIRKNVYELVDYLKQNNIFHVIAHPLFDLNHKLTFDHFEKMLLLFKNIELNGARNGYQNSVLKKIVHNLTPDTMNELAIKHNLNPVGDKPWIKNLTSGSDDHSSLNIARSWTFVPDATTKQEFFQGILENRAEVKGHDATPLTMAHNIYSIIYQFYKSKFNFEKYVNKDFLLRCVDSMLTVPENERGFLCKIQELLGYRRPHFSFLKSYSSSLTDIIQKEAQAIIANNPRLQSQIRKTTDIPWDTEVDWFHFVNDVSEKVIRHFADTVLKSLTKAQLFDIFQTLGSAGSLYTLLSTYFIAFGLFSKDRQFGNQCLNRYVKTSAPETETPTKVALFTDTFYEINGVALSLQLQLNMAQKYNKDLTILTCNEPQNTFQSVDFSPIGTFELPEYPELKLNYPPFLKMLEYCYEQGFTHIHSSTPGPVGLAALGISKILGLPLYGTYHTALPQYAAELTGDYAMEELMWKYMSWYYNQMDMVYVPSRSTAQELVDKGIKSEKICFYPRGIDTEQFNPSKRNGFWQNHFHLKKNTFKLLYVGRVSKEKNLDTLSKAYQNISQVRDDVQLIVVGDGPYLASMQQHLQKTEVCFTGLLQGEDLAQAYASSDIFLFPSSTDTFGNVVLEAQASGLPVIVTDQGGPQENIVNDETGLVVPAHDHQALSSAVMHLLNTPTLLEEMKSNARTYTEDRSLDQAFLQSWDMYHNTLDIKNNTKAARQV